MRLRLTPSGGWAGLADHVEDRALPVLDVQPGFPSLTTSAPLNVTTANALRVADAYACVRLLADTISTLPWHVYRRTEQGRQPAGDNARIVQLLKRPAPGSTVVDLISQIMVHLNVHGEAFVGKYRADGEIVQLALIPPQSIQVELRGRRIVYLLDTLKGRTEHGPADILHIKGMSEAHGTRRSTSTCRRRRPTARSGTSRGPRCGRSWTPRSRARTTTSTRRCTSPPR